MMGGCSVYEQVRRAGREAQGGGAREPVHDVVRRTAERRRDL